MKKLDYLLVVPPSKKVIKFVDDLKKEIGKKIGNYKGIGSTAHVTITNYFNKYSFFVEPLIPHLTTLLALLPELELHIKGFDFFESGDGKKKTIYAKIIMNEATIKFFDILRDMVNGREIVPHITIIKDLNPETFDKIWPMFKDRNWEESFSADKLTILRRETFNFNSFYENISDLTFKGLKPVIKHIYKNRKRRSGLRGSMISSQINLFD